MNRITTLLLLGALLPFFSFAQVFPFEQGLNKTLPPGHAKQHLSGPGTVQPPAEAAVSGLNYPVCAFDELNELHAAENPDFEKEMQRFVEEVVPALSSGGGLAKSTVLPVLTVSVVVHVIHNGEPVGQGQNLSAAQIQAQLAILNEDFASLNLQFFQTPGAWAGLAGVPNIEFCLASADPVGNPTTGITRHNLQVTGSSWNNNNINSFIKPQTNWDPSRYFNIYVLPIPGTTSAGGVVGFSNYPTTGQIGAPQDGVVIDYRWFGAPGFGVSGWRALTHETGHYLGLPHTFNGNSCNNDDGIADTPNIDKSTREYSTLDCSNNYPAGPVSCSNEHLYVNYMDYVNENCYTSFTNGQASVMRAVLDGTSQGFGYGSRNGLIQNAPQQCNLPEFDAGITRIISPQAVTCTPNQLTPVVTLRNFGTEDLVTVNIKLQVNNGIPVNFNWQGNLFQGESEDVVLPAFTPPAGEYDLHVFTTLPNGQADQRVNNDTTTVTLFTHVAVAPPMKEDFEGETGFPVSTGIFEFNITNDDFAWELTDDASGFGAGETSAMFDNFSGTINNNPYGTIDALITRHFNLSNVTGAQLKFDVAYAPVDNFLSDSLLVLVATNCSQNFNQLVYKKGGVQLSTAPPTDNPFIPTNAQWRTETIDLSNYDGMSDVTLALINLSGWGNRLYIDNIRVGMDCSAITHSFDIIPNGCDNIPGMCNGSATIQVANHNGGLKYQWAGWPPTHNLPVVYQICPQQVSVTVTDDFGCQIVASANVPQSPPPTLNISSTQVTTYNGNNGTATVSVTGGVSPYNYYWSNGVAQQGSNQSSSTISGLSPGTYTVTVENGNGCENTASVTVSSVCANFAVNVSVGNISCHGGDNGSIQAIPLNGVPTYQYLWSTGATSPGISDLVAGNYTVTVTSGNGCPATKTATVLQPTAITLNMTSTAETMFMAEDGTATASASGGSPGYNYSWSNGGTTKTIVDLSPGTYTVTVTDIVGCEKIGSVVVNSVSCANFIASISSTHVICQGENNGTATVTVTGSNPPVTYSWSNGQTGATVSNLSPGLIQVTVSDQAGCSSQLSATITEPPLLMLSTSVTHETAVNANNGTATATATGNGNLQYLWSHGPATAAVTNLAPGTYSVTVTDVNGCETSKSVTVQEYSCGLSIDLSSQPASCPAAADGSAVVSTVIGGAGPYQYLWSNGGTGFMISNVIAGNYTVTVSDAAGCVVEDEITVTASDNTPPVVLTKNITVSLQADGTVTLTGDMVDNGSWDNCSLIDIQLTPAIFNCSNIGQNTVTVLVTDSNNNTATGTAIVTVKDQTAPVLSCPGNLSVNTCDVVTYTMPNAQDACSNVTLILTGGFNSGQVFPSGTTTVTWTATDSYGNAASCSFEVTVDYDLTVDSDISEPSCHGLDDGSISLLVQGGAAPYSMNWSPGGGFSNLSAGTYVVTVTDANNCTLITSIEVGEPEPLEFQLQGITPATAGSANGTISFEITGGTEPYQVMWSDGNGQPLPGFSVGAVAAGTYQASILDANGCGLQTDLMTIDQVNAGVEAEPLKFIHIYPNPSSGVFTLQLDLPLSEQADIAIFDINGKRIFDLPETLLTTGHYPLDLKHCPPGVYWLKIRAGNALLQKRLIILK